MTRVQWGGNDVAIHFFGVGKRSQTLH